MVGNEDKKWAVVVDEGPIWPSTVWNMDGLGRVRQNWKQGNQVQCSCVARADENQK